MGSVSVDEMVVQRSSCFEPCEVVMKACAGFDDGKVRLNEGSK